VVLCYFHCVCACVSLGERERIINIMRMCFHDGILQRHKSRLIIPAHTISAQDAQQLLRSVFTYSLKACFFLSKCSHVQCDQNGL